MNKIYKGILLTFSLFVSIGLSAQVCPTNDCSSTDDQINGSGNCGGGSTTNAADCGCPLVWNTTDWGVKGNGNHSVTLDFNGCTCHYGNDGDICNVELPAGGLPVEYIYFKAANSSKYVQLNWATATEINNEFFSVEYSRDGLGYKESVGCRVMAIR